MTTDASIEKKFSRAASTYDAFSPVQDAIAEHLTSMLPPPEKRIQRILEIGCGTGHLTQRLIQRYPEATIDALDISAAMIQQAQDKIGDRPHWICKDYREFSPTQPYDLICSSSTLHWLTPLDKTLNQITEQLTPDGSFVASLMLHDTFKELHQHRDDLYPHKVQVNRLPSLTHIATILPEDYELEVDEFSTPLPSSAAFFKELRKLGVTGGAFSETPLSPGETRKLMQTFSAEQITWQVGYLRPF